MAAANAGQKDGIVYDAETPDAGQTVEPAATLCRAVTVHGDSAQHYAWHGQQAIIDADRHVCAPGRPCMVLLRNEDIYLKRKTNRPGEYESINPAFPLLKVAPEEVLAEWPVVGVFSETRMRSPIHTKMEQPAPSQNQKAAETAPEHPKARLKPGSKRKK